VRLAPGGAAGHLKQVTRNDLAKRYGYFLDHLSRRGMLAVDADKPAAQVIPEYVDRYVAELKSRVGSVTVYGSIVKLHRVARLIAPAGDYRWLAELEADLRAEMRPKPKFDRLVLIEVLIKCGLTLMAEAEIAQGLTKIDRARRYRNGLMIALLGCCPIRVKNFAALELGQTFLQIKGAWWIVLEASMTKEGRPDERPVPQFLTPFIDTYLKIHRPALQHKSPRTSALWLSRCGTPMKQSAVQDMIPEIVLATTGVRVPPHYFRMSAASTAAIYAPDMPGLGSALLHHTDPRMAETHYNRAGSFSAAAAYSAVIDLYRD
jgi:integrase/recombinase XerD